ncbi:hypothetical protein GCM10012319_46730 [Comamonas sp. KCTC 72670]|nr:hypothetical protein GCM10012319_46730 [Comamonas sp. KCTC 72670]
MVSVSAASAGEDRARARENRRRRTMGGTLTEGMPGFHRMYGVAFRSTAQVTPARRRAPE